MSKFPSDKSNGLSLLCTNEALSPRVVDSFLIVPRTDGCEVRLFSMGNQVNEFHFSPEIAEKFAFQMLEIGVQGKWLDEDYNVVDRSRTQ